MSLLYFFGAPRAKSQLVTLYGVWDWLITREMAVSIVLNKACLSSVSREASLCETFLPCSLENDFMRAFKMSKRGKGHFSDVIYGTIVLFNLCTVVNLHYQLR